jgi:hypothetical protein
MAVTGAVRIVGMTAAAGAMTVAVDATMTAPAAVGTTGAMIVAAATARGRTQDRRPASAQPDLDDDIPF